jgi:hypothetical protein
MIFYWIFNSFALIWSLLTASFVGQTTIKIHHGFKIEIKKKKLALFIFILMLVISLYLSSKIKL